MCNFNCEYCHNPDLKNKLPPVYNEQEVFNYLEKRGNLVDALVISGGEPTLWGEDLIEFSKKFRRKFPDKYLKLDTNGWNPEFIRENSDVFNYLALDFKSFDYSLFSKVDISTIEKSISYLFLYEEFEIRITMYPKYIYEISLKKMSDMLKLYGIDKVSLQQYKQIDNVTPYDKEYILIQKKLLESKGFMVTLKGI